MEVEILKHFRCSNLVICVHQDPRPSLHASASRPASWARHPRASPVASNTTAPTRRSPMSHLPPTFSTTTARLRRKRLLPQSANPYPRQKGRQFRRLPAARHPAAAHQRKPALLETEEAIHPNQVAAEVSAEVPLLPLRCLALLLLLLPLPLSHYASAVATASPKPPRPKKTTPFH